MKPNNTHPAKLVKITRCQDCPITTCDQRQPCGSIPDTCILDDAPAAYVEREFVPYVYQECQGNPEKD
jgi:hypothetical protein